MIVFSSINPDYFQSVIGYSQFRFTKEIFVFNLLSYDIRFPKLSRLLPPDNMSDEAFYNDDSEVFEREYFDYLNRSEAAFIDLMHIITREHIDGTALILIETSVNNQYCDSIVSSLIKYLYNRYGIKPVIVQDAEDFENIKIENSVFSPEGLMVIDNDIAALNAICPEMVSPVFVEY